MAGVRPALQGYRPCRHHIVLPQLKCSTGCSSALGKLPILMLLTYWWSCGYDCAWSLARATWYDQALCTMSCGLSSMWRILLTAFIGLRTCPIDPVTGLARYYNRWLLGLWRPPFAHRTWSIRRTHFLFTKAYMFRHRNMSVTAKSSRALAPCTYRMYCTFVSFVGCTHPQVFLQFSV